MAERRGGAREGRGGRRCDRGGWQGVGANHARIREKIATERTGTRKNWRGEGRGGEVEGGERSRKEMREEERHTCAVKDCNKQDVFYTHEWVCTYVHTSTIGLLQVQTRYYELECGTVTYVIPL